MDAKEIRKVVLAELKRIAPELEDVAPAKPLRDQVVAYLSARAR